MEIKTQKISQRDIGLISISLLIKEQILLDVSVRVKCTLKRMRLIF